jgi:hypothetical protein
VIVAHIAGLPIEESALQLVPAATAAVAFAAVATARLTRLGDRIKQALRQRT